MRLPSWRRLCSRPIHKGKKATESHSGHLSNKFSLHRPFPVHHPFAGSQLNLVTAVSLVPNPYCGRSPRHKSAEILLHINNIVACQVLVHDAAVRRNAFEETYLNRGDLCADSAGHCQSSQRWKSLAFFSMQVFFPRLSSSGAKNSMTRTRNW